MFLESNAESNHRHLILLAMKSAPRLGQQGDVVVDVSTELNLAIVNWSVDSEDWRSREVGAKKLVAG